MSGTKTRYGRLAAITAAAVGAPAVAWVVHPMLSAVIASLQATSGITIMGTALFGSDRLSERAFRLLRWATDRPEPPKLRR
ncbi:hypothetical protein SAMN05216276_11116 [Streptosporangium subroseum]|uniref:Uncharacterized protein n=2 Tax=Streptosporangium subroseum TaxID=106412 RepID=A0A239PC29_9ACTN|nr:hypothetical protein SAMN05216276_11116 [Streptosporangium subroseum]